MSDWIRVTIDGESVMVHSDIADLLWDVIFNPQDYELQGETDGKG